MQTKTKFDLKLGMATREAFGKTLAKLGAENPKIVVCDADLSKSTYTSLFAKEFPNRFFECGIAEVRHLVVEQHQSTVVHQHVLRAEVAVHECLGHFLRARDQPLEKGRRCGDP